MQGRISMVYLPAQTIHPQYYSVHNPAETPETQATTNFTSLRRTITSYSLTDYSQNTKKSKVTEKKEIKYPNLYPTSTPRYPDTVNPSCVYVYVYSTLCIAVTIQTRP